MLRISYESAPEQLLKCSGAVSKCSGAVGKCSGAVSKSSGTVISLPEQLVSAPEQLGYADFLHTMTPIRFHTDLALSKISLK